jgi:hypothetical protein
MLAFVSSEARKVTNHDLKKKVLSKSRRVSEGQRKLNDAEEEEEEEYAFLQNYKMKMIQCISGEPVRDPESGEYEMNAIVYRMCPSSGDCGDDGSTGCKEGYGDYVVGLNTYVQAYMEEQAENMQYDDNFDIDKYSECGEYENDNDDGNGYQYFIGPACTEDGTDIKLDLFYDEYCTQVPEDVTFEQVSNGWELPYSSGGLVSTYCTSCKEANDDGEYETKEMCERLYESSGKCETNMEYFHYYGKQEGACEYITELMPKSSGGASVGTLIVIAVVAALGGYVFWWKKKKATGSTEGLMA